MFLLIWQMVASFLINKEWLLPTPGAVVVAFGENLPLIWHHSLYTLAEAGLGMVLAIIVSLGIALLLSLIHIFSRSKSKLQAKVKIFPNIHRQTPENEELLVNYSGA